MLKSTRLYKFYDQVKSEAGRVTWPKRKEVGMSTLLVMVSVTVFSMCCLVVDFGIHHFVQFVLGIGK